MTEDIRLYNLRFQLLYIAHRVKTTAWELYYNKVGTFEAHIALDKQIAAAVFDNKYLIAIQGSKQAFITAAQINTEIVLYGKTLNYFLTKRTVMPFNTNRDGIKNNPVTLCNKLVADVFINDRRIEDAYGNAITIRGVRNMIVRDNSAEFIASDNHFWRTAAHTLSEVIIDRLNNDGLGHRLVFDPVYEVWRFEIYSGTENPIVLEQSGRNFYNADYTCDISNICNAGFYEITEEYSEDGSVTDEERDKEYIFVSNEKYNADADGYNAICEWDRIISGSQAAEALVSLEGDVKSETVTGTAARISYGADYELGDTVRVQLNNKGFKKTLARRITGVKVYRENNEETSEPILEEIKKEISNGD